MDTGEESRKRNFIQKLARSLINKRKHIRENMCDGPFRAMVLDGLYCELRSIANRNGFEIPPASIAELSDEVSRP